MATNHLPIDERIKIGKQKELAVIDLLNTISSGEEVLVPAIEDEDKRLKIDAWLHAPEMVPMSVQIKIREEYPDLGVAVLMPYDDYSFVQHYGRRSCPDGINLDRDMRGNIDLYVLYTGARIIIVEASKIKSGVWKLLDALYKNKGFGNGNTTYSHPDYPGACLKRVKDRGQGYSVGEWKVIAYFEPDLLVRAGAFEHKIGWQK